MGSEECLLGRNGLGLLRLRQMFLVLNHALKLVHDTIESIVVVVVVVTILKSCLKLPRVPFGRDVT